MNHIDRFRLDNKIALVSGGSRGIGEAICHGLAEQGAHVIVSSRKLEGCEKVAADIRARGFSAEARQCHAGMLEDIDALMAAIEAEHGGIDILVNNGATNPYFGAVEDTPMSAFDKVVEVNYRGPFYLSEKAVAQMKQRGGGSIVNVCSVNGITPGLLQGAYSTTKAALINMTKSFALECGQYGIRANALCPGLVETKLAAAITGNKELVEQVSARWPLRRVGQPADMVGAVLFLVSEASSYMTGQTLVVDGGATNALI